MTDPKARAPEYWRRFGWWFAVAAVAGTTTGIVLLLLGTLTGWISVALGAFIGFQSFMYFRAYRRSKREQDGGDARR